MFELSLSSDFRVLVGFESFGRLVRANLSKYNLERALRCQVMTKNDRFRCLFVALSFGGIGFPRDGFRTGKGSGKANAANWCSYKKTKDHQTTTRTTKEKKAKQ